PIAGPAPRPRDTTGSAGAPPFTAADFQIDVTGKRATVCPAARCPVKLDRREGAYILKADLVQVNIEGRRRVEATEEWRKRYGARASGEVRLLGPHQTGDQLTLTPELLFHFNDGIIWSSLRLGFLRGNQGWKRGTAVPALEFGGPLGSLTFQ
ncbi:MAG TPA: hypothetical protein VFR55_14135, partial [Dehalococcoidia bacterium]|nr:hypothetical protein [Dehalococcoidia bacterium]